MRCNKCGYESDIDFAHACPKAMAHITQGELMRISMQIKQLTEERDALKALCDQMGEALINLEGVSSVIQTEEWLLIYEALEAWRAWRAMK